jgi:hypothetical protein
MVKKKKKSKKAPSKKQLEARRKFTEKYGKKKK